jgi:hypothetical protein
VTDVRLGLHRQPAQVDPGLALLERDEVAGLAGGGVVEPDGHAVMLSARAQAVSGITGQDVTDVTSVAV